MAQDTFHAGTLEGVGCIDQQTAIDTAAKIGLAKLHDRETALTAADLVGDRVIPFFKEHELPVDRVPTDRSTELCGAHDRHADEFYLAAADIDHTPPTTKSQQTNGICERFHKTMRDAFYRVAFRKRVHDSIDALQADLDVRMEHRNELRTHQEGRWFGKTPMHTLLDSRALARERQRIGETARRPRPTASIRRTPRTPERRRQTKYVLLHMNSPGMTRPSWPRSRPCARCCARCGSNWPS